MSGYLIFIGSLAGALIMWATQVTPQQAVSHASIWAKTFGVQRPPDWLKSEDADRVIRHVGAIILAVCLLDGVYELTGIAEDSGTKILFGIGCVAVVGAIVWHLIFPDKGPSPLHFIALGLLITVLGAGWQYLQPTQTDISGAIKPLQDQIDSLKKQLAQANSQIIPNIPQTNSNTIVEAPPTQKPLGKNYFGPEKEELGTLLSKISDQLNGDALTAAKQGYHYYDATMPASKVELEALMQQVEGTANLVHSVWNQIWDTVDNNPKFKAELVGIVGQREGHSPNAMTPINRFYNSLQLFQRDLSILVDRIDELPEKDRAWIILGTAKRSAEDVVYKSNDFQAWINECNSRIDNMRDALR